MGLCLSCRRNGILLGASQPASSNRNSSRHSLPESAEARCSNRHLLNITCKCDRWSKGVRCDMTRRGFSLFFPFFPLVRLSPDQGYSLLKKRTLLLSVLSFLFFPSHPISSSPHPIFFFVLISLLFLVVPCPLPIRSHRHTPSSRFPPTTPTLLYPRLRRSKTNYC